MKIQSSILAVMAGLIPMLHSLSVHALDAESLVGITYYQAKENRGDNAINPDSWEGLPAGVKMTYGHLMEMPGDSRIEFPQQFGWQGIRIGAQSFLTFDLISNFEDGHTYNRILGALETTGTTIFSPCFIGDKLDPEIIAVLTANELASVSSQQPSRMDGIAATVKSPQNVYRLNRRSLRIERLDGSHIFCKGWPSN